MSAFLDYWAETIVVLFTVTGIGIGGCILFAVGHSLWSKSRRRGF